MRTTKRNSRLWQQTRSPGSREPLGTTGPVVLQTSGHVLRVFSRNVFAATRFRREYTKCGRRLKRRTWRRAEGLFFRANRTVVARRHVSYAFVMVSDEDESCRCRCCRRRRRRRRRVCTQHVVRYECRRRGGGGGSVTAVTRSLVVTGRAYTGTPAAGRNTPHKVRATTWPQYLLFFFLQVVHYRQAENRATAVDDGESAYGKPAAFFCTTLALLRSYSGAAAVLISC